MSNYVIEKVEHGIATIRYPDGSWANLVLSADMTEEDLDEMAWAFKPKVGGLPKSFEIKPGQKRTASPKPTPIDNVKPQWLINRIRAYGDIDSQIEFITEQGLEAWQEHVSEIKKMFPKEG